MRTQRWTSPTGKTRLLTTLDRHEASTFATAAALSFPRRPRGSRSFDGSAPGHPRPWYTERRAWRAAVRSRLVTARRVIVADVADCYPSIGDGAIRAAAATVGGDPEPLLRILDRIHDGGVEGVPIGPAASVAIADAVLAIADACARTAGADPIRWVDDVMFVGDRADVERAASAWRSALKELGLAEQEEKRQMFDDAHLAEVTILPRPSLWR